VGLANIRARLAAQYGERATLKLEANSPRGVVATIRLPWSRGGERP
jgi:LytS/YehU family sensor histidine kinase